MKIQRTEWIGTLVMTIGGALVLSACSLIPQPKRYLSEVAVDYNPADSARVRFYVEAGTSASYRADSTCYSPWYEEDSKRVAITGTGLFDSWKYSSHSTTIGMPQSPRPWMRFEGLVFKSAINEYVVKGAKPLTISMSETSQNWKCDPPSVSFVPEPGKDYDVFMSTQYRRCWIEVREIDAEGKDIPIKPNEASRCSASS